MNKKFVLVDKTNNLERNAEFIVRFSYENKDYLVYSTDESEQNKQIFASRLVLNSEGKYFIDGLSEDEKGKISNLVYNIVILLPTDNKKGTSYEELANNFKNKYNVQLSIDFPSLDRQEYHSTSSIAVTSDVLASAAKNFYQDNLKEKSDLPTWTVPTQTTTPSEITPSLSEDSSSVSMPSLTSEMLPKEEKVDNPPSEVLLPTGNEDTLNNEVNNNQRIAVVSDPSLGFTTQRNMVRVRKAGFANIKYIVIGTVCLVLAIAVVVVTYFLIKNMNA